MNEQTLGRITMHGQDRYVVLDYQSNNDMYTVRNEATGEVGDLAQTDVDDYGVWTERTE